ncbi:MAG: Secreted protein [Planctomycetaceae bacterium]|nr:Secreted protein [Planctomycetaceae bacterium]
MKQHLNLLPWKLRWRMLLRQRLRHWVLVWSILAVGCGLLYAQSWHGLALAQDELEIWQRRAVPVQAVQQKNASLQRKIAELQERLAKYGHLDSEQIGFQLLATISQSAGAVDGKIQVQKLAFKQTQVVDIPATPNVPAAQPAPQPAPGTPVKKPKMKDVRTLTLSGVAASNLVLAQFVSSLRDSGAFHTVDLKLSTGSKVKAGGGTREFQVECSF